MSAEPYYSVGPSDVFPEQFAQFLIAEPKARAMFLEYHAELMDPAFWQGRQAQLQAGVQADVFPYPENLRFPRRP
jgi:isocitrate dehydrogenase kinase/phosphatase